MEKIVFEEDGQVIYYHESNQKALKDVDDYYFLKYYIETLKSDCKKLFKRGERKNKDILKKEVFDEMINIDEFKRMVDIINNHLCLRELYYNDGSTYYDSESYLELFDRVVIYDTGGHYIKAFRIFLCHEYRKRGYF